MPAPFATSSYRAEFKDHLAYVCRALEQLSPLDDRTRAVHPTGFRMASAKLEDLRRRYEEPLRLAIVGEFKAGKSTLINVLLGRPGLVPEGVTPTTGAFTEIWWDENERGEVHDGQGQLVFSGAIAEAARFADQRSELGRRVSGQGARVTLHVASDFLKNLVC